MTVEEADDIAAWEKAIDLFEGRFFEDAGKLFSALTQKKPRDGAAQLYADRCAEYLRSPPPEDWDGVNNLTEK
jgi:adenylate cyclase